MKRNRQLFMGSLILLLLAAFTFSVAFSQEKKEEAKVIKLKLVTNEDGSTTIDTTIIIGEDFDGDWKELIGDEAILEKLEDIEIEIEANDDGSFMIMNTGGSGHKYVYVMEMDEEQGEMKVDVEKISEAMLDVHVATLEGDSVKTFVVKTVKGGDEEDSRVLIWHSGGDEVKLEHKIVLDEKDGKDAKIIVYTTRDGDERVEVISTNKVIVIKDDDKNEGKDKKKKDKKDK